MQTLKVGSAEVVQKGRRASTSTRRKGRGVEMLRDMFSHTASQ